MSDDTPKTPPEDSPAPTASDAVPEAPAKKALSDEEKAAKIAAAKAKAEAKRAAAGEGAGVAEEKAPLSDEEKAAKIAAAKAKAEAKKAAAGDAADAPAEPKPPWEDKPAPPVRLDAMDDGDVVALAAAVEGAVLAADSFAGDVTVRLRRERVLEACRFLKEARGYSFLVDLTAVDWPEREGERFDVVYWMHRFDDSKRLRLVAGLPDGEAVASVESVWKTANWLEREVYDMFGIHFEGHPGLERILTWEGFNGHPLRKDFPVEGIDTGAAIYPEVYPPGGGPLTEAEKGGAQ